MPRPRSKTLLPSDAYEFTGGRLPPGGVVFSVFNIGTGHTQTEPNNTIAWLGRDCIGPKIVNDGPNLASWGMDEAVNASFNAILAANPATVVMTGHSRGAVECHILADKLGKDTRTQHIKIYMIVLDPVNMSAFHAGATELSNHMILSYHAIIMTHDEAMHFPPTVVTAGNDAVRERRHWITMPGQHGSGTQCLTSAVGSVALRLIARYMRAHGTIFSTGDLLPIDMCNLFAQIYIDGGMRTPRAAMTVWDDDSHALRHETAKTVARTTSSRSGAVTDALRKGARNRRASVARLPSQGGATSVYFFNHEHAYFFQQAFPYLFHCMTNLGSLNVGDFQERVFPSLDAEIRAFEARPALRDSAPPQFHEVRLAFGAWRMANMEEAVRLSRQVQSGNAA